MEKNDTGGMDVRRVEDPTNGVIDQFGLGEGLVATFVGDDPNPGSDEACPEAV